MKINSQHYRFASFVSHLPDEMNLCPYARRVMLGLAVFSFVATLFAAFVVGNLLTIASIASGDFAALLTIVNAEGEAVVPWFILTSSLTIVCAFVAGFFFVWFKIENWFRDRKYAKIEAEYLRERAIRNGEYTPMPEPEPGFVRQWYNSVHDKVCPVVKFE